MTTTAPSLRPLNITHRVLATAVNCTGSPLTEVRVEYAYFDLDLGEDVYAIRGVNGTCLDLDGDWVEEKPVAGRDDPWLSRHRFPEDVAFALAHTATRALGHQYEVDKD